MKSDGPFPSLRRLCGVYLHQDFDVHGPRPEDAVAAFSRDLDPAGRAALRAEIARFLALHDSDAARLAALDRFRFAVDLSRFGYASAADFLAKVVEIAT